jgi:anti-sigma factor RsiW
MSIRDDVLLAYVDGELDAAARADVDAAIAADPQLAQRVQQQQALRQMLSATYDPVLDEPMPARLLAAAQAPLPSRKVVDLGAERANRQSRRALRDWSWPQWAAMAASWSACSPVAVRCSWRLPTRSPHAAANWWRAANWRSRCRRSSRARKPPTHR